MKLPTITAIVLASLSSAVHAVAENDNKYDVIENECRETYAPDLNNTIVMGCADMASSAVKKDMNIVYQKIYKELIDRDRLAVQHLEKAQRSWLEYRENTCDLQGLTIGTPMYSVCRLDLNLDRLSELNSFLEAIK